MQGVYLKTAVSYWRRARRCVRLAEWVPPVGGALSRHTSTWQVQAASWGTQARPSGAPKQAAEAMPSSRGDAKQPRRRAGRRAGALTRGGGGGVYPRVRMRHTF
jgi:hypothetical protein